MWEVALYRGTKGGLICSYLGKIRTEPKAMARSLRVPN